MHVFTLTMVSLCNVLCDRSDKSRWIDALSPAAKEDENEKIYEEWGKNGNKHCFVR